MKSYETLLVNTRDRVTTITLHRPAAANTMNARMVRELADAALHAAHGDAKVVVLTGSGRFFCAGGDSATSPQPITALDTSRPSLTHCIAPS